MRPSPRVARSSGSSLLSSKELELGHLGLTDLKVVGTMHERKALMAELSDAFVALPGGFGTVEEFCEVLTWAQLGLHAKPCALLNVDGFFDPLLDLFEDQVEGGFLSPEHRAIVLVEREANVLLDRLQASMTTAGIRPMDLRDA